MVAMTKRKERPVIELWTHPFYVDMEWMRPNAPEILEATTELAVLVVRRWDGEIDSLPRDKKVMVWASSTLSCDRDELVERCRELGHFCFYCDQPLSHPSDSPAEAVRQWFAKEHSGR